MFAGHQHRAANSESSADNAWWPCCPCYRLPERAVGVLEISELVSFVGALAAAVAQAEQQLVSAHQEQT